MLRCAHRYSRFYRNLFKRAGVDALSVKTLEHFSAVIPVTTRDQVEESVFQEDSTGGRRAASGKRNVLVQLEPHGNETLFVCCDSPELLRWSSALSSCFEEVRAGRGQRILICDYGSSPAEFLASSSHVSYLKEGACERLGMVPICNDGLSRFLPRAGYILEQIKPQFILARADLLPPMRVEIRRRHLDLRKIGVRRLLVTFDEFGPSISFNPNEFGITHSLIPRIDAALYLSIQQPGGCLMQMDDLYYVEALDPSTQEPIQEGETGMLTVTNLFSRNTISIRYMSHMNVLRESNGLRLML